MIMDIILLFHLLVTTVALHGAVAQMSQARVSAHVKTQNTYSTAHMTVLKYSDSESENI